MIVAESKLAKVIQRKNISTIFVVPGSGNDGQCIIFFFVFFFINFFFFFFFQTQESPAPCPCGSMFKRDSDGASS